MRFQSAAMNDTGARHHSGRYREWYGMEEAAASCMKDCTVRFVDRSRISICSSGLFKAFIAPMLARIHICARTVIRCD